MEGVCLVSLAVARARKKGRKEKQKVELSKIKLVQRVRKEEVKERKRERATRGTDSGSFRSASEAGKPRSKGQEKVKKRNERRPRMEEGAPRRKEVCACVGVWWALVGACVEWMRISKTREEGRGGKERRDKTR